MICDDIVEAGGDLLLCRGSLLPLPSGSERAVRLTTHPVAYVRALLQQAVVRRRMIDAADRYAEFVRDTPEERTWLAEWDSADLVTPPKRRRR